MKKRLGFLLSATVILVSAALVGCQGGKSTESRQTGNTSSESHTDLGEALKPTEGGTVVIGMTQDIVSLDPHVETDAGTRSVVFNLYEGLVKPTVSGELSAAVASDYKISDDAKTYTFTLRDGVTFHDGSAVTAEDVKYSIERFAENSGESSAFSNLDEVVIADEKTVEVKLKEGYSEFLPDLAEAVIIPKSVEDINKTPVGTGPYKFTSYTPGQNIKLEKYDGYWGEQGHLDSAEFKIIADVDTAFMELQAGTIDVLNYLTADKVAALGDDFNIVEGNMHLVHAMFLNNDFEPFKDVKVRQALCYAVDRQAINDFLFGGKSKLIGSHMIPALSKYYESGAEDVYTYDPEKAKQLLAEAGYADGFDLEITVPSSYSQHVDSAQIIAEQLKAVGINANLKLVEWSTWLDEIYNGRKYEATVIGFDGTLAPNDWLKKYRSDASNNIANFKNDEYDKTLDEALKTVDEEEKVTLYKKLQMILAENAASVYIEDPADFVAVNKRIGGYEFYPIAAIDVAKMYTVQ